MPPIRDEYGSNMYILGRSGRTGLVRRQHVHHSSSGTASIAPFPITDKRKGAGGVTGICGRWQDEEDVFILG